LDLYLSLISIETKIKEKKMDFWLYIIIIIIDIYFLYSRYY
jgi:hypothetical protein